MKNTKARKQGKHPGEHNPEQAPSILVQVESIKRMAGFKRTRCVYYRVEGASGPLPWTGFMTESDTAVFIGWSGWSALSGPGTAAGPGGLFTSAKAIEKALSDIEEDEELFLDTGHVWVPNWMLEKKAGKKPLRTGDVYRLTDELFLQCYRFTAGMITEQEWLDFCEAFPNEISPSPRETAAFRTWRRNRVKQASVRYHSPEYEKHKLRKKKERT